MKMHEQPELVCMPVTLGIFRFYGIFPARGKESNPGVLFYCKFFTIAILSSLTLIGSLLHLIHTIRSGEHNYVDLDLTYIISFATAYALSVSFVLKMRSSFKLYSFFSNFEEFRKPIDFDRDNERFNIYSKLHFIYLESLIFLLLFLSNILKGETCRFENEEYGLHEVCGLFTYTWMPFDIDFTPVRQLYTIGQVLGGHYMYMLAGLLAWLVLETMQHLIVRIRDVKYSFREAFEEKVATVRKDKLKFAIRYHNAVLSLQDELNGTFGVFMFTHVIFAAALVGAGIYCFFHRQSLSSFLICIGWFFGLMMDCFSGQRLLDETLSLAETIYDAPWYDYEKEMMRDVLIVLARCQKPMKLKAGPFGVMDRATFLAVMKATYSYITLMESQRE